MAKRHRQLDELERLQLENRRLKATNRSLMTQLKKLSRGYYKFLADEEEAKDGEIEKAKESIEKICWECGIGKLIKVDLGNRYLRKCNNDDCSYKTRTKTKEEA